MPLNTMKVCFGSSADISDVGVWRPLTSRKQTFEAHGWNCDTLTSALERKADVETRSWCCCSATTQFRTSCGHKKALREHGLVSHCYMVAGARNHRE